LEGEKYFLASQPYDNTPGFWEARIYDFEEIEE